MNKTVLFLINGLGIEHKDSYNIYSNETMPVLDQLTQNSLFTSIETPALNYADGYKLFSTSTLTPLSVPHIDNVLDNNLLLQNPKFNALHQYTFNSTSNIHLFCFIDNDRIYDTIKRFLQFLDSSSKKTVFVHFVLCYEHLDDYKMVHKVLNKIQYEFPANVKIGMIFGKDLLFKEEKASELNDLVRAFYRGTGERWKEIEKKINSLRSLHITPNKVKTFYVSDGFVLNKGDTVLFFNYENFDCSRFINLIKKPTIYINNQIAIEDINFYSLFPLTNSNDVPYLYENIVSDISLAKALEKMGGTTLVLTDKDNLSTINFMCNGLANVSNSHIKYILTDNGIVYSREQMENILNDPSYQLIIVNHHINHLGNEKDIRYELMKIDQNLEMFLELCKDKYSLVISSLFGMKKYVSVGEEKQVLVDFSGMVPVILVNSLYPKRKYRLVFGNTYNLCMTVLKLVKPDLKISSLLKRKGLINSILFR